MDDKTYHAGVGTENGSAEQLDSLWRQFGRANSEREFCTAWLALQCSYIAGVASGVVLLGSAEEDRPYVLAASWPEGPGDFKHLAEVAERSLKEKRGLALKRQATGDTSRASYDLAYPVHVAGRLYGVVALDVESRGEASLRDAMRQLQWGSAWMEVLCHRNFSAKDTAPAERLQTVATLLSQVTRPKSFHGAAVALVTAMATRFECDRVTIGILKRGSIRTEAMSHTGQFGQDTNLVRAVDAAMNEAMDQDSAVVFPEAPHRKAVATRAHEKLARESGNGSVCSVPLPGRDRIIGVLTLERAASAPFDDETVTICESLASLVGPTLETHRRDDRWLVTKAVESGVKTVGMLIGPSHILAKLVVVALIGVIFFLSRATGTYRVTADTVLEPAVQLSVATAFDGYIRTAPVRAGDVVKMGDELATLDDREYQLERARWQSQHDQSLRQYHEALGNGNPSQAQIFQAQVSQSRAQVDLLDEQIARTKIKSPFNGVIVTGDLSQSLGVPVQRGQVLFQIAPLDSYRVILQVDERDIADVSTEQHGQLVLSGSPDDPLAFKVRRITPVSTASEGRNYFRVEAELDQATERLKPGMEGVGKIEVDTRKVVWIWTHEAMDWLRLKIWNWLP